MSRTGLRRDPAGWNKPRRAYSPLPANARSNKVRDAPQVTAPTRGALQPAGTLLQDNKYQPQGRAKWVWSWSSVRKPDTRFPPASRLIAKALGAARCFSRAPVARSVA